jgi:outer membrane protein assembly factor BamB
MTNHGDRAIVQAVKLGLVGLLCVSPGARAAVQGWLDWRGPQQNGVSAETGLPEKITRPEEALWTVPLPGQSTPVIAEGRLYINGYLGEGPELQEVIACFDAGTGHPLWEQRFSDFLSDTIYLRYATSSPAIDPETGNVYMQGTQGLLACFSPDGRLLWQHSLMEMLGRLTFPNSRTASPVVDRDLVITRGITANWGAQGAGADRFYAFDKRTGDLVWSASPGDRPKDNSFSHPYLMFWNGRRVLIAAGGDGSVVCVNARTGESYWRIPLFKAGINATVLVHNQDKVIAVYGTPYERGEMVALRIPSEMPTNAAAGPLEIPRTEVELWRAEISSSTSSPILVGDRVYLVAEKGDLHALEAATGRVLWRLPLGIEQRNSCPLFADGRLYVPILENPTDKTAGTASGAGTKGAFYIIQPGDEAGTILSQVELDGRCFGTPVAYAGKIYLQTTRKLYCFGRNTSGVAAPVTPPPVAWPAPGPEAQLQILPAEVMLHPGEKARFRVRTLDAAGFPVREVADLGSVSWAPYVPATARVRSAMKASFNPLGELVAAPDKEPSAGAFQATLGPLHGLLRGRVLPDLPIQVDFESYPLSETTTNTVEPPTPFAYPPLPWIGARFRFDVREKDGSKVLTKTIDNKFFQRGSVFLGDAHLGDYTIEADLMSEGTRRKMSEVGLINQRYITVLKGNSQELEVNSNQERLRQTVPFAWSPNTWYHMKTRVDRTPDGAGVVRSKVWKRGEPEPARWTIEVPHRIAHGEGAPGLYGFSPQDMRVFIDNIRVTAN